MTLRHGTDRRPRPAAPEATARAVDPLHAAARARVDLRHLRQALRRERPSAEERDVARQLRGSRERIADGAGVLRACAHCVSPALETAALRVGGACCGGRTEALFDEVELASLAAAGTRPRHLRPLGDLGSGCLFLGSGGCSLPPRHRPNRCLRYLCPDVQRELHGRDALSWVEGLCAENEELFGRYARLRRDRLESDFCEALLRRLR